MHTAGDAVIDNPYNSEIFKLHGFGRRIAITGAERSRYAYDRLVASFHCSCFGDPYRLALPPHPELAGASFSAHWYRGVRGTSWLAWARPGAWIGPTQLLVAIVFTGIAGGIMALCWAVFGGFIGELFKGSSDLVFGLKKHGLNPHPELVLSNPLARKMPYAPAIAIGTLISFFSH
jgi:hypothetical protein